MDYLTRVLVSVQFYLPDFKSGGPVRSIANLVTALGSEREFRVVTRNCEAGGDSPIAEHSNSWVQVEGAAVKYLSRRPTPATWIGLLRESNPDYFYINSLFSPAFSLAAIVGARLMGWPSHNIIVAPRGELSPGALAINPFRKLLYCSGVRVLSIFRGVVWHATSELEANHIRTWFGRAADVHVAANIATRMQPPLRASRRKSRGMLSVAFASRIARKKNLDFALRAFTTIQGDVSLAIYGPLEDEEYWRQCEQIIQTLPGNVRVALIGPLPHDQLWAELHTHHLFFFPTKGENFGHVIAEALLAGCPALLSDATPWRDLRHHCAGYDLPLGDQSQFSQRLQEFVDMDDAEWQRWSAAARALAESSLNTPAAVAAARRLFPSRQRSPAST
jgi:glycosyltransferase involved in cell wall biosynthesis